MASADDRIETAMRLDDGEQGETKECGGVIFEKMGATWKPVGGSNGFHEVEDKGNYIFGKLGASTYVLDDTGTPISTGHHEISGVGPFRAKSGAAQLTLTNHMGVFIPEDPARCKELAMEDYQDHPAHIMAALRSRAGMDF